MQHHHLEDAFGVLNSPFGAGLRAMLASDENVRAALAVDLDAHLHFGTGMLVVTQRRLLACDRVEEVCRILRPLFSLIDAKAGVRLDYARLLNDLLFFNFDPQRTKSQWAMEFYRRAEKEEMT